MKDFFKKLVKNNNKFKLSEFILNDAFKNVDEFSSLENEDILFFLNTICMLNNEEKLRQVLEAFKLKQISLRISQEFIYYLIREKNVTLLEMMLEFARTYLHQDLRTEKIGQYLDHKHTETTLGRAIKSQNIDIVRLLVDKCGATVDLPDTHGRLPIYIAAGLESLEIIQFLVEKGANLNQVGANGDTPLLRACQIINLESMKFFISHGGQVNFKGYAGNAALHTVIHNESNQKNIEALKLVLNAGGDLTLKNDNQMTCFVRSCGTNSLDMIKFIYSELTKNFDQTDYLNSEIIEGTIHAINYLRADNLAYLIQFVQSKQKLNERLKNIFDLKSSSSIFSYYVKINHDRKIFKFHEIFMKLIQYDFHPFVDNILFYVELFIELANIKLLNRLFEYEALQDKRILFISCITFQLTALIKYGKLNIHRENCLRLAEQYPNLVELKNEIKIIVNNLKLNLAHEPMSLQTIALNKVRGLLVALTDDYILKLNIPNHLNYKICD